MNDEFLNKIIGMLNTVVEDASFDLWNIDEDLKQLGMDSIAFITAVVKLEAEFGISVPDEYMLIEEMDTIRKMHDAVEAVKGGM